VCQAQEGCKEKPPAQQELAVYKGDSTHLPNKITKQNQVRARRTSYDRPEVEPFCPKTRAKSLFPQGFRRFLREGRVFQYQRAEQGVLWIPSFLTTKFFCFFLAALGFELRAYTMSHSASSFYVIGFFS
jgi:hypothetical protein